MFRDQGGPGILVRTYFLWKPGTPPHTMGATLSI